ncbi:hypothetical protein C8R47DRAFT_50250 [Mycena vitilis]|nr:hypothetical protein C8R47DRAFT_50250 [Mycena vitilis]
MSAPPPDAGAVPSVDNTLGALLIGVLVSYVLFGVTTTQSYLYSGRFPNDSRRMKFFVTFVWFCELAHVICIGHTIYILLITDFGHPERLSTVPLSLGASSLFNGIIAMCVQGFFSLRIYRLSSRVYLPLLTWTLSLLFLGATTVVFVHGLERQPFAEFESQWGWLLNTLWSVAAVNDLIIAVALVFWLWRGRDESAHVSAVVDKLITWTIETGVVTSAAAVINLVCFVTMKNNYIWIAWYFVTARLYSNSLLASLNSRAGLRTMTNGSLPYPRHPSQDTATGTSGDGNFLAMRMPPHAQYPIPLTMSAPRYPHGETQGWEFARPAGGRDDFLMMDK